MSGILKKVFDKYNSETPVEVYEVVAHDIWKKFWRILLGKSKEEDEKKGH